MTVNDEFDLQASRTTAMRYSVYRSHTMDVSQNSDKGTVNNVHAI